MSRRSGKKITTWKFRIDGEAIEVGVRLNDIRGHMFVVNEPKYDIHLTHKDLDELKKQVAERLNTECRRAWTKYFRIRVFGGNQYWKNETENRLQVGYETIETSIGPGGELAWRPIGSSRIIDGSPESPLLEEGGELEVYSLVSATEENEASLTSLLGAVNSLTRCLAKLLSPDKAEANLTAAIKLLFSVDDVIEPTRRKHAKAKKQKKS